MGIINFDNVSFQYPNGFSAVENVSFEIQKGERIAIVGQNGAGKTTTVKMMNGLLKPTNGTVLIDGRNTKDYTTAQLSRITGYVFQNPDDQIFHNSVREEIEFGPKVLKFDDKKGKVQIDWAADICGLREHLDENPYNLPLSIRKFVTIASVLAMDEKIVVLDEPTAGQDLNGLRRLAKILDALSEKDITVVTITHDMEFVVENFDSVYVMAHKNLLRADKAERIFQDEELLEESMLKKPYLNSLVSKLGLQDVLTTEGLIQRIIG